MCLNTTNTNKENINQLANDEHRTLRIYKNKSIDRNLRQFFPIFRIFAWSTLITTVLFVICLSVR